MSNNNTSRTLDLGAMAFITTIVFIVLKLFDIIQWSWLWVLSPIWICLIVSIVFLIFWTIIVCFLSKIIK